MISSGGDTIPTVTCSTSSCGREVHAIPAQGYLVSLAVATGIAQGLRSLDPTRARQREGDNETLQSRTNCSTAIATIRTHLRQHRGRQPTGFNGPPSLQLARSDLCSDPCSDVAVCLGHGASLNGPDLLTETRKTPVRPESTPQKHLRNRCCQPDRFNTTALATT